jgi:flagellar motor switch protein FliN
MWIVMNNGFLSQEEINSLLSGETSFSEPSDNNTDALSSKEKDLISEIGKSSMESAAKTLEMITSLPVKITKPVVTLTTIAELKTSVELPVMSLEVKYISGIEGINLLIHKTKDAQVIASLMMGGDGKVEGEEISELEESAVSEAMNQMIGSAATTMSGMLGRSINISPPVSKIWKDDSQIVLEGVDENVSLIQVSYSMTIGDLVDSNIIQLMNIDAGKNIAEIMTSKEKKPEPVPMAASGSASAPRPSQGGSSQAMYEVDRMSERQQPTEVHDATFQPLRETGSKQMPKNIDLILDVPLEISVVLGRTKKAIKEILTLGAGSLIELDKLAEEPVEVLVNGKQVAFGEVVVVGENFGVRITSIVSNVERLKSFG